MKLSKKQSILVTWCALGGIALFVLFYLSFFVIPCYLDPTDCSGRDMAVVVITMPMMYLFSWVIPESFTIVGEMFVVFIFGIIQFGLIGFLLSYGLIKLRNLFKK
ncbi:MAG: hypothetical protein KAZ30_00660 [Candidatus Magasanikbacteria bacterium]|nr:hypothetical protein [Candidatus Magasanikbacteria bacterium]